MSRPMRVWGGSGDTFSCVALLGYAARRSRWSFNVRLHWLSQSPKTRWNNIEVQCQMLPIFWKTPTRSRWHTIYLLFAMLYIEAVMKEVHFLPHFASWFSTWHFANGTVKPLFDSREWRTKSQCTLSTKTKFRAIEEKRKDSSPLNFRKTFGAFRSFFSSWVLLAAFIALEVEVDHFGETKYFFSFCWWPRRHFRLDEKRGSPNKLDFSWPRELLSHSQLQSDNGERLFKWASLNSSQFPCLIRQCPVMHTTRQARSINCCDSRGIRIRISCYGVTMARAVTPSIDPNLVLRWCDCPTRQASAGVLVEYVNTQLWQMKSLNFLVDPADKR